MLAAVSNLCTSRPGAQRVSQYEPDSLRMAGGNIQNGKISQFYKSKYNLYPPIFTQQKRLVVGLAFFAVLY